MIIEPSPLNACTVRALLVAREGISDYRLDPEFMETAKNLMYQCLDFISRHEPIRMDAWDFVEAGFPFFYKALISGEFGKFEKVYKVSGFKENREKDCYELADGWHYKALKTYQAIQRFGEGRYIYQIDKHVFGVLDGKICCDPNWMEGKERSRVPVQAVYRYIGEENGMEEDN